MRNRDRYNRFVFAAAGVLTIAALGVGQSIVDDVTVAEAQGKQAPMFEVDPFWPKPLPNNSQHIATYINSLITTFEPIKQFSPMITSCSIIELLPIVEFFPIFTFLPINTFLPNSTDLNLFFNFSDEINVLSNISISASG